MKIYTKTGDNGTTSLYDGNRISKGEFIFDVLGDNDDLSSKIGLLYSSLENDCPKEFLRVFQRKLQDINTIIATVDTSNRVVPSVYENDIETIEKLIDEFDKQNPRLTNFILPGVTMSDSYAHLCRTASRKSERNLWFLSKSVGIIKGTKQDIILENDIHIDPLVFKYMNRLSDFFFVFARWLCSSKNISDCML